MSGEVLAAMAPGLFRRWFSFVLILLSGGLLVYAGFSGVTEGLVWKLVLIGAGLGLIGLGERLRRATAVAIELTADGLRESSGRVLCAMEDIEKVERGAFAFKPSNGLMVLLKTPGTPVWAPGLWWRYGKRIGIGGVTSAGQAKLLADAIALHRVMQDIAEEDR